MVERTRYPARYRALAEPGDRHRPGRRRLRPGHGLADDRGTGWDEKGRLRTHAPSTYKIPLASDRPKIFNVTLADWPRMRGADDPSLEGGRRAAASCWHVGAACAVDAVASVADHRICPRLDAPATPERVLMAVERLRREAAAEMSSVAERPRAFLDARRSAALVEVVESRAPHRAKRAPGCWCRRPRFRHDRRRPARIHGDRQGARDACDLRGWRKRRAARDADRSPCRSARRSDSAAAGASRFRSGRSTKVRAELVASAEADDAAGPMSTFSAAAMSAMHWPRRSTCFPPRGRGGDARRCAEGMPDAVEAHLTAVPEEMVRHAPPARPSSC